MVEGMARDAGRVGFARGRFRGRVALGAAALVIVFAAGGCSKQKPVDTTEGAGLTEGTLDGSAAAGGNGSYGSGGGRGGSGSGSGSSMDEFRRGTLGTSGQQGPLQDVHFGYDSYELGDSARELLRINGDWLQSNPAAKVEVEGHTDSRGTVEYNLALGAKRATAVRDYLVSLGVSSDRLTTISYGKELPICQEESESCWAQDRRAHFVILGK
ncbi:MAG: peptidoglycan-associated lipoprotein Pal [Alphaproteobacteria bacterium]